MVCKKEIGKMIKTVCLRRKLYFLEKKRISIIQSFIDSNPSLAAKSDNIELQINTKQLSEINIRIRAIKKLLKNK